MFSASTMSNAACIMCETQRCCPDHCCNWDDCACGDCQACGGPDPVELSPAELRLRRQGLPLPTSARLASVAPRAATAALSDTSLASAALEEGVTSPSSVVSLDDEQDLDGLPLSPPAAAGSTSAPESEDYPSATAPLHEYVRLRASDDRVFVVPRAVAEVSSMLRGLLAGTNCVRFEMPA